MVGVLNLDKPAGLTSAAAVGRLRRSSGEKRVGHGGTLDPQASGVLPVFFGRATVLAEFLSRRGKSYLAGIRFGAGTSTDDATGDLEIAAVPGDLGAHAVETALSTFVGDIEQSPPAYSAIKVAGERSYKRARRGAGPDRLAPRRVVVEALRLIALEPPGTGAVGPIAQVEMRCGPGFYVRALARDLGEALGTRAHLETLVRTSVGPLRLDEAMPLADAEAMGARLGGALCPPSIALGDRPRVAVASGAEDMLRHGRDIAADGDVSGEAWAADGAGRVLALGRVSAGRFQPRRLVEME